MTPEESFELTKKKGYLVVKGNDLIQRNRFELSLMEQKTVAYICSMIKPIDSGFQSEYEFNVIIVKSAILITIMVLIMLM